MEPREISHNFQLAKVVSILAVIVAHFVQVADHPLIRVTWIGAQTGLAVFAFSSGYFTSAKYGQGFQLGDFWRAKIARLFGPLLVCSGFLAILFVLLDKPNLLHWQTPVSALGLGGLLRFLDIDRVTPFGNGLWFLTLLLLFYLAYPWLARGMARRDRALAIVAVGLVLSLILPMVWPLGVTFWQTAWAFVLGTFVGRHAIKSSPKACVALILLSVIGMPLAQLVTEVEWVLGIPLAGLGVGSSMLCLAVRFPRWGSPVVVALSGMMLPIYVLHTYLFAIGTSGSLAGDFLISMILLTGAAAILNPACHEVGKWLEKQYRARRPAR